jgi:hypothetical protein
LGLRLPGSRTRVLRMPWPHTSFGSIMPPRSTNKWVAPSSSKSQDRSGRNFSRGKVFSTIQCLGLFCS